MTESSAASLTLLFSDIEGSTRLVREQGDSYAATLEAHRRILRGAFDRHGGRVVDSHADEFFVAFPGPLQALSAAVAAQRELADHGWPEGAPVRVRMGLHTGSPTPAAGGFIGLDVHRAARISAAAHGAQVLVSAATAGLVRAELANDVDLRDLGEHRLKGLIEPERIFQVVAAGLPADFPPPQSLDTQPNNLPTPATPFVGRLRLVARIRDMLRRPEVRILTLTGPGGAGKTRVALRVAGDLLHEFADGAFFVDLAALPEAQQVLPALAETLGVVATPAHPLEDQLRDHLRERKLLVVMDNFEHVREAAPALAAVLSDCLHVKLLATSRSVLGLYGEHAVAVPPLAVPEPDAPLTVDHLVHIEAVQLFLERAQAARPDFTLDDENAQAVAEICRRVEGLPLAIELAAARIRMFAPAALATRLQERLSVLTGGPRNLPQRQRTLRDALAWSYDLLAAEEQALFRRLAVFAGGWSLEAAEAVADPERRMRGGVVDGISALIESSLLRPIAVGSEQPRFGMLDTIREFGLDQLAVAGERRVCRDRHRDLFTATIAEYEQVVDRARKVALRVTLRRERENLQAALAWVMEEPERSPTAAFLLAATLWENWYKTQSPPLGRELLESVVALPANGAGGPRARALAALAHAVQLHGEYSRAGELATQALELYRSAGDKKGAAWALGTLGTVAQQEGRLDDARSHLDRGLGLAHEIGDLSTQMLCLSGMGAIAHLQQDVSRAAALYDDCLAVARALEEPPAIAVSLINLGEVRQLEGKLDEAASLYRESLDLLHELGSSMELAHLLEMLAGIEAARGRARRAAVLLGAAERLREELEAPVDPMNRARYDADVVRTRSALGESDFAALWGRGRDLSIDQAVAYVGKDDDSR